MGLIIDHIGNDKSVIIDFPDRFDECIVAAHQRHYFKNIFPTLRPKSNLLHIDPVTQQLRHSVRINKPSVRSLPYYRTHALQASDFSNINDIVIFCQEVLSDQVASDSDSIIFPYFLSENSSDPWYSISLNMQNETVNIISGILTAHSMRRIGYIKDVDDIEIFKEIIRSRSKYCSICIKAINLEPTFIREITQDYRKSSNQVDGIYVILEGYNDLTVPDSAIINCLDLISKLSEIFKRVIVSRTGLSGLMFLGFQNTSFVTGFNSRTYFQSAHYDMTVAMGGAGASDRYMPVELLIRLTTDLAFQLHDYKTRNNLPICSCTYCRENPILGITSYNKRSSTYHVVRVLKELIDSLLNINSLPRRRGTIKNLVSDAINNYTAYNQALIPIQGVHLINWLKVLNHLGW